MGGGSQLTPSSGCDLWPASCISDVSLSHPMAITGEVDGLQGDGLWGPLKVCLSARVWAQHIVLGAAREKASLSGGRGESIFCLGSRTGPSCLKAVGYKKCAEFMPEFSFQNA